MFGEKTLPGGYKGMPGFAFLVIFVFWALLRYLLGNIFFGGGFLSKSKNAFWKPLST